MNLIVHVFHYMSEREIECGEWMSVPSITGLIEHIEDYIQNLKWSLFYKKKSAFNREHGKPIFYSSTYLPVKDVLHYKDKFFRIL